MYSVERVNSQYSQGQQSIYSVDRVNSQCRGSTVNVQCREGQQSNNHEISVPPQTFHAKHGLATSTRKKFNMKQFTQTVCKHSYAAIPQYSNKIFKR